MGPSPIYGMPEWETDAVFGTWSGIDRSKLSADWVHAPKGNVYSDIMKLIVKMETDKWNQDKTSSDLNKNRKDLHVQCPCSYVQLWNLLCITVPGCDV